MTPSYVSSLPRELHGAVTVVGNAELAATDRKFIASSSTIIRFNDINNARHGDVTTYHVVRLPSAKQPHIPVHAPVWYVSPLKHIIPPNASMATVVHEPQYDFEYAHLGVERGIRILFPSCGDSRCMTDRAFAGPSTGAVILSALSESPDVSKIHVVGMNWNGPAYLHTDFAWRGMIRTCCKKCVIHPTQKARYGPRWSSLPYVVGGTMVGSVVSLIAWKGTCFRMSVRRSAKTTIP